MKEMTGFVVMVATCGLIANVLVCQMLLNGKSFLEKV
jgi:hypothetical protein